MTSSKSGQPRRKGSHVRRPKRSRGPINKKPRARAGPKLLGRTYERDGLAGPAPQGLSQVPRGSQRQGVHLRGGYRSHVSRNLALLDLKQAPRAIRLSMPDTPRPHSRRQLCPVRDVSQLEPFLLAHKSVFASIGPVQVPRTLGGPLCREACEDASAPG
jgi:hypothetical protein